MHRSQRITYFKFINYNMYTIKLEKFYLNRLRTIFPTVMNACVRLTNSKDQTMYLLCFPSANPSPKVKALVMRLAGWATKT